MNYIDSLPHFPTRPLRRQKRRRGAVGGAKTGPHAAKAEEIVSLAGKKQYGLHLRKDLPAPRRSTMRHLLNV